MVTRHMKRHLTPSVSKEIQMKTISKYYYIRTIDKMENDVELTGTLITASGRENDLAITKCRQSYAYFMIQHVSFRTEIHT